MPVKIQLNVIFLLVTTNFFGQNYIAKDSTAHSSSHIEIHKDARIDEIAQTYKSSFTLSGFRIQIFSDSKKQPARDEKAKFLNLYPSVKAHEIYQQPYFKVRIGDFRTKLEAYKFQKEIQTQFPNCFIVKDEIDIDAVISK